MTVEHPFAPYVRILGKGKSGSRSLDREEARLAMGMILDGAVRPEQLGAFLMLLRVKEEAPEELAGFADAVRERFAAPQDLKVDLDWSSYAGKKRRHTWYLLVALCLASHGYRIFMHGARGHTAGRIYVEDMLSQFGLKPADDWDSAAAELDRCGFTYLSIDHFCPPLGEIIQLRSIMGLRSPVHTLCRMLNPLDARCSIDGVFHPAYGPMHQQAANLLGTQRNLTMKGDGGEAEARPDADCQLQWVLEGQLIECLWPRTVAQRFIKEDELPPEALKQVWQGTRSHPYGEAAVISTLAVVLQLLGEAGDQAALLQRAGQLWQQRNIERFA